MTNTVVQFILDNILLFLPIGALGIIITIILFFLPKQENIPTYKEIKSDFITIFKIRFNIYFLVYLFIWLMIIIIGLLSNFLIPTLISGIIAAIPLIVLIVLEDMGNNLKVS